MSQSVQIISCGKCTEVSDSELADVRRIGFGWFAYCQQRLDRQRRRPGENACRDGGAVAWCDRLSEEPCFVACGGQLRTDVTAVNDDTPNRYITRVRPAGPEHEVVTVKGEGGTVRYRKRPCPDCPWRVDAIGKFPAEAFRHSAETAYDMATHTFGCHASGTGKPADCAGFLLRGADHNLAVRMRRIRGVYRQVVTDGGHQLHASYRAMSIANGVLADDPALAPCRSSYVEEDT